MLTTPCYKRRRACPVIDPRKVQMPGKAEQGVGLIEVLVALLIMSIGFLAAGNLQISSMRANQDSMQSAQALRLAGDMMDAMRNNPQGVNAGYYDDISTSTAAAPSCGTSGCSPQDLASMDLFTWSANFLDLRSVGSSFVPVLFGTSTTPAKGTISSPNADGSYAITIDWQGTEQGQPTPRSMEVAFKP